MFKSKKKKNEFVYVVKNSLINHKGGIATNENLEYLRNWHWSWSKFYYSKKHKGYIYALIQGLPKYFSSMVKYFFYFIINKKYKSKTYYNRALGFYNAMIGKSSWYRPKID